MDYGLARRCPFKGIDHGAAFSENGSIRFIEPFLSLIVSSGSE